MLVFTTKFRVFSPGLVNVGDFTDLFNERTRSNLYMETESHTYLIHLSTYAPSPEDGGIMY